MKRLIKKSDNINYEIGNNVRWKSNKNDNSVYTITQILNDGTLFIDNGIDAYTDINPKSVNRLFGQVPGHADSVAAPPVIGGVSDEQVSSADCVYAALHSSPATGSMAIKPPPSIKR